MKIMPFAGAIEYFRDKVAMTPDEFARLVDEVGIWAHRQAFTVARVASADVLQGIYDEVLKAIEEGTTFFEFREGIDALMERLGWEGLTPYRLDNIMRTNVQTAYSVGRYKKMKAVADRRPYWEYDAVNDSDTRKSHLAHDGKVYHHTHMFWKTWYPLNGYRCFPPWAKVMTKSGWRKIGSILPNDRVIGGSGDEKRVTAIHRNRFDGQLIRLIFKDGRIDATPNHRILTMRGWMRADKLNRGDILVETTPKAPVNTFICNKHMADTKGRNSGVTFPVKGEAAVTFAANGEIQRGNKNIEPLRTEGCENNVVMNNVKPKAFNMIKNHSFRLGRTHFAGNVFGRVSSNNKFMGFCKFFPNIRTARGSTFPKLIGKGHHALVILFVFSKTMMETLSLSLKIKLSQLIAGLFTPIIGSMKPLYLDGIAAFPGFNIAMPHESDESLRLNFPAGTKHSVSEFLSDVQKIEGLGDGAPLNGFDSIDGFRTWSGSHCILREIIDCEEIPYSGSVVNLSVETDESYIIQGATVHNCRCRVNSLSLAEMEEEGLKEETQGTDLKPDKGFEYNPAEKKWKPDAKKYHPQLKAQMEEALWD